MIDDMSLALAQAFQRVAKEQSALHINMMNLDMAKLGLKHGSIMPAELQQAKVSVARAEADLETAVRELATQLAAWKAAP